MIIVLQGTPKSTQHCYRYSCRGPHPQAYMDPGCKILKDAYVIQARQQYKGDPLTGPLDIKVTVYHAQNRKYDWDNFNKLAMDALEGIVYEDDSQIIQATVIKSYDKENPRIEIEIED